MKSNFKGWDEAASILRSQADRYEAQRAQGDSRPWLNAGQCASLRAIADRIGNNGVIIADEVGMGKTRIAVAAVSAVVKAGGRVAIVVPPGLGFQWDEELRGRVPRVVPPILRSLSSYLKAWDPDNPDEQPPWFKRPVVVVSHAFANWRLGDRASKWRRALLPEVYAQWQCRRRGRLPRFYYGNDALGDPRIKNAGRGIAQAVPLSGSHPGRYFLNSLLDEFKWTGSLDGDYSHNSPLRRQLEQTVGLGLGVFDLVIIDEAHKSRGTHTGLSRLLDTVIFVAAHARRICMTATPVELDVSQWEHPLRRIGLDNRTLVPVQEKITAYHKAVTELRQCWRASSEARSNFAIAAEDFQNALRPYVLRRDKREDEHVREFCRVSGLDISRYRCEREIWVDMTRQPHGWKVAVCGAEALSVAARQKEDAVAKRLRLTLGNGHGIAAFLDETKRDDAEDNKQEVFDSERAYKQPTADHHAPEESPDDKRLQRCAWWQDLVKQGFGSRDTALFDHPGIRAAVEAIEERVKEGEKTLVFGRFTQPMSALTDLLNAREMLRRIHSERSWPQRKVHGVRTGPVGGSEWPAVRAAWQQLSDELSLGVLDEGQLDSRLDTQYRGADRARERFRESLVKRLGQGLEELVRHPGGQGQHPPVAPGSPERADQPGDRYRTAYEGLRKSVDVAGSEDVAVVARALMELSGRADQSGMETISARELAGTFGELVDSAMDRDDPDVDEDGDGKIDDTEAVNFWGTLLERIKEEYGRTQSGFARFMYGQTSPSSRRLIQQAFNRPRCSPMVLVAQSMVGREGLNLHKACRTVILLHPEWNPGIVEQQIGRVDRVSSHWCTALEKAVKRGVAGDDLPRIEVLPIVFEGTYDQYNWTVLRRRWDDLRAQLHGIIIPERLAESDRDGQEILLDIKSKAPCFSPVETVSTPLNHRPPAPA